MSVAPPLPTLPDISLCQLYRLDASIHTIPVAWSEKIDPLIYLWYDDEGLLMYANAPPPKEDDGDLEQTHCGVFRFIRKLQGFLLYEEIDEEKQEPVRD